MGETEEEKMTIALGLLSGVLKKIENLFPDRVADKGIQGTKKGIFLSVLFKEGEETEEIRQEKEDEK